MSQGSRPTHWISCAKAGFKNHRENKGTADGIYPVNRVAYLVGHHHRPEQINGIDYQILIETDYIVNASENGYSQQAIRSFMEHTMKTVFGV